MFLHRSLEAESSFSTPPLRPAVADAADATAVNSFKLNDGTGSQSYSGLNALECPTPASLSVAIPQLRISVPHAVASYGKELNVLYRIFVEDLKEGLSWYVEHRYSTCRRLFFELDSLHRKFELPRKQWSAAPSFPSRQLWTTSNRSKVHIENRRVGIENCMSYLLDVARTMGSHHQQRLNDSYLLRAASLMSPSATPVSIPGSWGDGISSSASSFQVQSTSRFEGLQQDANGVIWRTYVSRLLEFLHHPFLYDYTSVDVSRSELDGFGLPDDLAARTAADDASTAYSESFASDRSDVSSTARTETSRGSRNETEASKPSRPKVTMATTLWTFDPNFDPLASQKHVASNVADGEAAPRSPLSKNPVLTLRLGTCAMDRDTDGIFNVTVKAEKSTRRGVLRQRYEEFISAAHLLHSAEHVPTLREVNEHVSLFRKARPLKQYLNDHLSEMIRNRRDSGLLSGGGSSSDLGHDGGNQLGSTNCSSNVISRSASVGHLTLPDRPRSSNSRHFVYRPQFRIGQDMARGEGRCTGHLSLKDIPFGGVGSFRVVGATNNAGIQQRPTVKSSPITPLCASSDEATVSPFAVHVGGTGMFPGEPVTSSTNDAGCQHDPSTAVSDELENWFNMLPCCRCTTESLCTTTEEDRTGLGPNAFNDSASDSDVGYQADDKPLDDAENTAPACIEEMESTAKAQALEPTVYYTKNRHFITILPPT